MQFDLESLHHQNQSLGGHFFCAMDVVLTFEKACSRPIGQKDYNFYYCTCSFVSWIFY